MQIYVTPINTKDYLTRKTVIIHGNSDHYKKQDFRYNHLIKSKENYLLNVPYRKKFNVTMPLH